VNSPAVYEHIFVVVGGFVYIVETISKTISYKKNDKKQIFTIFFSFYNFPFISGVIFDQRPQV